MNTTSPDHPPLPHAPLAGAPRVLFLGMLGAFSRLPLAALLAARVDVRAVLLPAERSAGAAPEAPPLQRLVYQPPPRATLPMLTPAHTPSIVTLAQERDIPALALEVSRADDPAVVAALTAYEPDALCVACWPRRLPAALLALARLGCLNLHPALLPAHRGPTPLFWILRHGDAQAGVTVHLMDETLDSGDILAQEAIALPDGIVGDALEQRCAAVGGRLLANTVFALARGTAHRTPQSRDAGSYEPWPTPADLVITPDHPARWAYNFIRGAAYWAGPMAIAVAGHTFTVRAALDYTPDGTVAGAYRLAGDELWLACAPGVLHVALG